MTATTTPLAGGTDIGETIGGKVFSRAILYDESGAAVPLYPATQPISAEALPLPAGAATSARQDEAKAAIQALGPQGAAFAITPHATNALERQIGGIAVVTGGTIVYRYPGESTDRTITLPAGFFPLVATHIRATSTAAGLTGF